MIPIHRVFIAQTLLFSFLLLCAVNALALKESRLWLPKKHMSSMPQLIQAAKLAEQNPECLEVLNGQMDRGRSKKAKSLVFRIDCRNENGLSFSLVANAGDQEAGVSRLTARIKKKTHKVKPIDEARGWKICRIAIVDALKKMINPALLEDPTPKPFITDVGESLFYVDFDAETVEGYPVYFVSICKVLPSGKKTVEVKPRKLVTKPKGFDIKRKVKRKDSVKSNPLAKKTRTEKPSTRSKPVNTEQSSNRNKPTTTKTKTNGQKVDTPASQNNIENDGWEEIKEIPPAKPKVEMDQDGWEVTEEN